MRELELVGLRAKLRNKLKEQEFNMNAGDKRNNLANVCYLSKNRIAEFREWVSKCKPLINPVVNKSVEDATSCDFEQENCEPPVRYTNAFPLSEVKEMVTEKNKRYKIEEGIKVYRISDYERKVGSIAGGESVRAVAVGAQRVMNSGDIGVGSLGLIVDKGLTGPEALICENNCKKKDTVATQNASKIVPFQKKREAGLNAASIFSIENTDPVFPTQGDGTGPTIEFPAFVEKNEGESTQRTPILVQISVIDEAITGTPEEFSSSTAVICGPKAKSIHQKSRLVPKFPLAYLLSASARNLSAFLVDKF
ncbi:hypothetical protein TNCV_1863881 [Trichonephila clavipes]|nr:hypothetical protein TNCV_1863881 [Trichonephila clavipes]